jgi:putative methionine-R-sulfoxide reductase with GAF domain
MTTATQSILERISTDQATFDWSQLLTDILAAFDCSTGTIHTLDRSTNLLHLKAYEGIPEFLLPKMTVIPVGKGMAGVAAERRQPVQICNLQTDESGVARPSARDTKVEGSMAAPMMLDGELYGTLGIAKSVPYDFSDEETDALMEIGKALSQKLQKG